MQFQNCIAFWRDTDLLVFTSFRQAKTSIMAHFTTIEFTRSIVFIAILHRIIRNELAYRSLFFYKRISNFIFIIFHSLFVEDYSIPGFCILFPFRIDCRFFRQLMTKFKSFSCRVSIFFLRSSRIPSNELVTKPFHFQNGIFICLFTALYELWCIISTTFAVFLKDKPVSFIAFCFESHISLNGYICSVFIGFFFICDYIFRVIVCNPSFKIMFVIRRIIALFNSIRFFRLIIISTESNCVGSQRHIIVIQINNCILLYKNRIESHFRAIHCGRQDIVFLLSDILTNLIDCKSFSLIGVVYIRCPAFKDHAFINSYSVTWIIQDLLHVIVFFDVHVCNIRCIILVFEVHMQTSVFILCRDNSINREPACCE